MKCSYDLEFLRSDSHDLSLRSDSQDLALRHDYIERCHPAQDGCHRPAVDNRGGQCPSLTAARVVPAPVIHGARECINPAPIRQGRQLRCRRPKHTMPGTSDAGVELRGAHPAAQITEPTRYAYYTAIGVCCETCPSPPPPPPKSVFLAIHNLDAQSATHWHPAPCCHLTRGVNHRSKDLASTCLSYSWIGMTST